MAIKVNNALAKKRLDATVNGGAGVSFDNGTIKFYTGTQAADADTAIGAQVLVASIALAADSFGNATGTGQGNRTVSALSVPLSVNAANPGTITWARIADSTGVYVIDCDVAMSAAPITVDNTTLTAGQQLQVTSLTLSE